MTDARILFWLLSGLLTFAAAAPDSRPASVRTLAAEAQTRIFADISQSWQPYLEARYRHFDSRAVNPQGINLLLGSYHSPHPNLRLGLFYRAESGTQHDNDWVKKDTWQWERSNGRIEHHSVADFTLRTLTDWIPGSFFAQGMLELKSRWHYNFYRNESMLQLRPGFTKFIFSQGQPLINLFFQYEIFLLPEGRKNPLWDEWVYLGSFYFINNATQLGFLASYRRTFWETSDDFSKRKPGESYQTTDQAIILSLVMIYRHDF